MVLRGAPDSVVLLFSSMWSPRLLPHSGKSPRKAGERQRDGLMLAYTAYKALCTPTWM